jgi:aryl-alcohol dehydrogenase-like predicted oxidoreductase
MFDNGLSVYSGGAMPQTTKLPTHSLGRTGREVTLFGLGGEGVLRSYGQESEARKVIQRALDLGVNYFDSAPAYAGCLDYYGAFLGERRTEVFLASKTADRTRDGSLALLDATLRRLRSDYLDLWQLHDVRTRTEVKQVFSSDGAIHALLQARAEGRVRHVGITGHHNPAVLVEAMEQFDFDTVLIPLNCADVHRLSFVREVLPVARAKGTGVIAMKVYSAGLLATPSSECGAEDALRYALSLDGVACAIVGCRTTVEVEDNARIVREFTLLSDHRRTELEARHSEKHWTPYKMGH